jgi:TRAP-type mannitol/chloroaromatic compound transport system permease large subunit
VLTVVVLAVILFGICTATESAAIGALGALYLAVMAKYQRQVCGGVLSARSSESRSDGGKAKTLHR